MEKRDKLTPLGRIVASARRIAADMNPKMTAKTFWSCFLSTQRQIISTKLLLHITFGQ